MARVTTVKSARAIPNPEKRRCIRCGHVVQAGEPYKHVSLKTGAYSSITRNWCKDHNPRASELTANDRLSTLYGCQESLEDDIAGYQAGTVSLEDLKSNFDTEADDAEAVADEYEEGADNLPESLQQSSQAEESRQKATDIREWADRLRSVDWPDEEEFDPDKCAECEGDRDADQHNEGNEELFDHEFEEPDKPEAPDVSDAEAAIGELSI